MVQVSAPNFDDEVIEENYDRELIKDFVDYTQKCVGKLQVFRLKIDKMSEVNSTIVQPLFGTTNKDQEKCKPHL